MKNSMKVFLLAACIFSAPACTHKNLAVTDQNSVFVVLERDDHFGYFQDTNSHQRVRQACLNSEIENGIAQSKNAPLAGSASASNFSKRIDGTLVGSYGNGSDVLVGSSGSAGSSSGTQNNVWSVEQESGKRSNLGEPAKDVDLQRELLRRQEEATNATKDDQEKSYAKLKRDFDPENLVFRLDHLESEAQALLQAAYTTTKTFQFQNMQAARELNQLDAEEKAMQAENGFGDEEIAGLDRARLAVAGVSPKDAQALIDAELRDASVGQGGMASLEKHLDLINPLIEKAATNLKMNSDSFRSRILPEIFSRLGNF
jgi:hypothetical protein